MINNQRGFLIPLVIIFSFFLIIAGWMFFQSDISISLRDFIKTLPFASTTEARI